MSRRRVGQATSLALASPRSDSDMAISLAGMFSEESVFEAYPYRRGGVFVDVGANVGTFVASFAERGWRVVAFEPHPTLYARLEQRFGGNPRVLCIQRAISDEHGKLPFYTSNEHPGIHSLAQFHPTHEPTQIVDVSTLGTELAILKLSDVTALKIDVEGADFLALRGFNWDGVRPELVMVEFMDSRSSEHFGYTHHDMAAYMQARGYETWVSEWAPLVEYGKTDEKSSHKWMGFHAYDVNGAPAHGNLLFVQPADSQKLKNTVRRVKRQAATRSVLRSIPGARGAVHVSRTIRRRLLRH